MCITSVTITKKHQNGWKNKGGTSFRYNCKCGSWKHHWENFSGRNLYKQKCSSFGCPNSAEQAAHVFCSEVGMCEWLIPLCKSCNHPTNEDFFSFSPSHCINTKSGKS